MQEFIIFIILILIAAILLSFVAICGATIAVIRRNYKERQEWLKKRNKPGTLASAISNLEREMYRK